MQYQTSQAYDASRQVYTAQPSQTQYPSQQMRFGGPLPGTTYAAKTDMGPPPRAGESDQQGDVKPAHGDEEGEHDHDHEYTHTNAPYNTTQGAYNYNTNSAGVSGDVHDQLSSSPHQNGSGRATPRTAATPQQQWQSNYNAPHVMEPRGPAGTANGTYFPSQPFPSESLPPPNKRVRDLDDDEAEDGMKRQKTGHESNDGGPVGGNNFNIPRQRAAPTTRRR
jgi:protein SOK2